MTTKFYSNCKAMVATITSGSSLALFKNSVSYEIGAQLLNSAVTDLHVITVPTGGLLIDLLIKHQKISHIETSGVSLGEDGPAKNFTAAMEGKNLIDSEHRGNGIKITDATCPAIYAGLQAAEKGIPFMPIRGLLGSDILQKREELKVINNPFKKDDLIVCVPPIVPDFTFFHVPLADSQGNIFIGSDSELKLLAHVSKKTLVSADMIVETNLLKDPDYKNNTISNFYIDGITETIRKNETLILKPFL
ncbi:MAG: hypothetical protein CBC29_00810 [Methylococcaceae bacterium TMED69]|nr:MAG: hypothetical protein CBC29_00810 [Methylococcaceae bacterium TMED69]